MWEQPTITDEDGQLVLHWPDGLLYTRITREALQALIDRANESRTLAE
jgi:hypothetical protein